MEDDIKAALEALRAEIGLTNNEEAEPTGEQVLLVVVADLLERVKALEV